VNLDEAVLDLPEDAVGDAVYAETLPHFVGSARRFGAGSLFVLSPIVFGAISLVQRGQVFGTAVFLAVLLLHELGHLAAMRAVGYRDVRIFFIPFFGAAASGHKVDASARKEAAVLLMGPLPGLLLSIGVGAYTAVTRSHDAATVTVILVAVNAFNLLPVLPLDGGRVFSMIFYSRWRWLEVACGTLSGLALIGIALWSDAYVLGALGLLMVFQQPLRARLLGRGAQLRASRPDLRPDPRDVDGAGTHELYRVVRSLLGPQNRDKPKVVAAWMRELLEVATRRSPGFGASVAIFAIWLLGLVAGLVGLVLMAVGTRGPQ
jgi:Zn-dependent protease